MAEEDQLRARLYAFLALLFSAPPDDATLVMLRQLAGDATPLGQALAELAGRARAYDQATAEAEYAALFVGVTHGEVIPYASYYIAGFLMEMPLAVLRQDLAALGIAAAAGQAEPEDHIATIFEVMHGLILGRFAAPADLVRQRQFFDRHIAAWVPNFLRDLAAAPSAALYQPVARLTARFLDIEKEAFAMS